MYYLFDQVIQGFINQIHANYDVENSDALNKQETKKFVLGTLGNLSGGHIFPDESFN